MIRFRHSNSSSWQSIALSNRGTEMNQAAKLPQFGTDGASEARPVVKILQQGTHIVSEARPGVQIKQQGTHIVTEARPVVKLLQQGTHIATAAKPVVKILQHDAHTDNEGRSIIQTMQQQQCSSPTNRETRPVVKILQHGTQRATAARSLIPIQLQGTKATSNAGPVVKILQHGICAASEPGHNVKTVHQSSNVGNKTRPIVKILPCDSHVTGEAQSLVRTKQQDTIEETRPVAKKLQQVTYRASEAGPSVKIIQQGTNTADKTRPVIKLIKQGTNTVGQTWPVVKLIQQGTHTGNGTRPVIVKDCSSNSTAQNINNAVHNQDKAHSPKVRKVVFLKVNRAQTVEKIKTFVSYTQNSKHATEETSSTSRIKEESEDKLVSTPSEQPRGETRTPRITASVINVDVPMTINEKQVPEGGGQNGIENHRKLEQQGVNCKVEEQREDGTVDKQGEDCKMEQQGGDCKMEQQGGDCKIEQQGGDCKMEQQGGECKMEQHDEGCNTNQNEEFPEDMQIDAQETRSALASVVTDPDDKAMFIKFQSGDLENITEDTPADHSVLSEADLLQISKYEASSTTKASQTGEIDLSKDYIYLEDILSGDCDVTDEDLGLATSRPKPYQCGHCQKRFVYKHNLTTHLNCVHWRGPKPFCCPQCGHRSRLKHHLDLHLRKHSGERPFSCVECDLTFTSSSNLRRHFRTHMATRVNPHRCVICTRAFSTLSGLQRHASCHDESRSFVCEYCSASFKRKEHLVRHELIHKKENGNTYPCKTCDRVFVWKKSYDKHVQQCKNVKMEYDDNYTDDESADDDADDDDDNEDT